MTRAGLLRGIIEQHRRHEEMLGERPPWWRPFARRRWSRTYLSLAKIRRDTWNAIVDIDEGRRGVLDRASTGPYLHYLKTGRWP